MNETAEPLEQALFAEVIAQRLRSANEELARVRLEPETLKELKDGSEGGGCEKQ